MNRILLILFLIISSCGPDPEEFSDDALAEVLITENGETTDLRSVVESYEGKKVLIDVWASWCSDCIKGLPDLKALQQEFPEVSYLFISVDRNLSSMKRGIDKYKIEGDHYFLPSMQNGPLNKFLNSNWIPRYMVLDESGKIQVYKATKATDPKLKVHLR